MSVKRTGDRAPEDYAETLRVLAKRGVPREPTEEALLDIVRSSLQIARDAFRRLDRKLPEARE